MRTFLIVLTSLLSLSCWAQTTFQGRLIDENGEALPYATIEVFSKEDSSFVIGESSNIEGKFTLVVPDGKHWLRASFLSYDPYVIDPLESNQTRLDLGDMTLEISQLQLEEIVVSTDKSQVEFKLDKRVFNVGKDVRSVGGNASDILDNLPGITVDVEGEVALRGSENVRILINGKPSGMGSAQALRQLQASMIERVEVITNPSARYEAEGEVGIINIVLKKNQKKGINGSVDLTAGYPENFGLGLNLNYRRKAVNLFTNIGVRTRKSPGGGEAFQESFSDTTYSAFRTKRDHIRGSESANTQFGLDWFLPNNQTITTSVLYSISDGRNVTDITYKDVNEIGDIIGRTTREDDENEISHDLEGSLNYTRTFDKEKKHKWTIDLQYQLNDDTEKSEIQEISDRGIDLTQRVRNVEDQSNLLFQSDYVHPFGNERKFEAGVRASLRNVVNEFLVEERDANNEWTVFDQFNNEMQYEEGIYAAYLIYGDKPSSFGYQFGIRTEYSDITTSLAEDGTENPRSYLDWFPSAHFTYDLSEKDQVQLSYSRRISRPRFRHLLPFYGYSDNRSLWQGNPDLNPEYTNSFEIGYLKYLEKGSIMSSLYYRYRTDIIQRITEIDSNNISLAYPINLGFQNAYGLEIGLNYDPVKWLQVNWNINGFYMETRGQFEDENLDVDALSFTTRFTTKFRLPHDLDLQSTFDYRGPQDSPQGRRKAMYSWDLGVSKDVWNKKGTITLSVRDVLNSRRWQSITESDSFYRESEFQWRARSIVVGFNYLINQDRRKRGGRNGRTRDGGLDIDMGG